MSARSVQIREPLSQGGNSVVVLQVPLQLVSEGLLYGAGASDPALGDALDLDFLIVTPADVFTHLFIRASLGGDGFARLFEDTTVSANGTARPTLNRNRNSANVADTQFFVGPTITGDGTLIAEVLLAGGESKNSVGSTASVLEEIILKPSSNYLVRLTNNAGTAQPSSIAITFFEEGV